MHYDPSATTDDLSVAPVARAEVLVMRSNVRLGRSQIEAMSHLRAVIRTGSGVDNIDVDGLSSRGIELITVGGAPSAPAVAELALQASIALFRRIPLATASIAAGRWEKNLHMGREIAGCNVAVWGYGPVGRAVAELFQQVGCKVSPLGHPAVTESSLAIETLCDWADLHVLALPLRPTTRNIVNRQVLMSMALRQPAIVNVGRWDLIDMSAALEALDAGWVFGLAVDPIETDNLPFVRDQIAFRHDRNLQLTPHLGAMTASAQERIATTVIDVLVSRLSNIPEGR